MLSVGRPARLHVGAHDYVVPAAPGARRVLVRTTGAIPTEPLARCGEIAPASAHAAPGMHLADSLCQACLRADQPVAVSRASRSRRRSRPPTGPAGRG